MPAPKQAFGATFVTVATVGVPGLNRPIVSGANPGEVCKLTRMAKKFIQLVRAPAGHR